MYAPQETASDRQPAQEQTCICQEIFAVGRRKVEESVVVWLRLYLMLLAVVEEKCTGGKIVTHLTQNTFKQL